MSAPQDRAPRGGASLAARGVVFEYAETPGSPRALDGVDVELAGGELVVVIGPNGSGKSTLLSLLAGHRAPLAGSVTQGGVPLSSLRPRERARRIAVVPQYLPALPEVLVSTFVESGRYAHVARSFGARGLSRADRESAERALAACDAGDLASRAMTELSGGQRQRVLVARAIAQEAPMLLIDEPTNALDPEHQIAVFELLGRLCAEGRGVLVVTHDLNLASQYATRLVLLERGRVAARGSAAEVLRREVLEPVYGADLYFGAWPGAGGRPYVLARRPG